MRELSNVESDKASSENPHTFAGALIVVGIVILIGLGVADGWQGEQTKQEQNTKSVN